MIYLQETYSLSDETVLELPGYLAHHSLALYTGRRPSRGVSTLFRIEAFVDGAIQVWFYLIFLLLLFNLFSDASMLAHICPAWTMRSLIYYTRLRIVTQRVFSPFDWVVVSRWSPPSQPGVIFTNTYLPIHSDGVTRSDVIAFRDYILDLMNSNPGDAFVLGGDVNFDPWRNEEHRATGYPIPPLQRCAYFFLCVPYSFVAILRLIRLTF